jgi:hypothetical protein
LRKVSFFDTSEFIFDLKNRQQPIPATRPSVLAGETLDPKDGDAMINDPGKREVKGEGFVAGIEGFVAGMMRPPA